MINLSYRIVPHPTSGWNVYVRWESGIHIAGTPDHRTYDTKLEAHIAGFNLMLHVAHVGPTAATSMMFALSPELKDHLA